MSEIEYLRKNAQEVLDGIEDLPTLPAIVFRVAELAQQRDVSIRDLKQLILTDPPLTAKIIGVANSAMYGRRQQATTIEQAIVTIGLDALISIAMSIGVLTTFNTWEIRNIDRLDLWRHSISTAFLAKTLEYRKGMVKTGMPDMFLAGILHDIGWIIIDQYFPVELKSILITADEVDKWNVGYERDILGYDHAKIGGMFLEKWNVPKNIIDVIANHHDADSASKDLKGHAELLGLSSWIAPYSFSLDTSVESVSGSLPNMLSKKTGEEMVVEMRARYANHIESAKNMADRMIEWM